jgi:hypothetical protein
MSKIVKMLGIALVIATVFVMLVAGTAFAATGNGNGSSSDGASPQYLHWGSDNSQGYGEPGDATGPDLEHQYGKS